MLNSRKNGHDEQPLVFEIGSPGQWAASLPALDVPATKTSDALPAELIAEKEPALPEVGELDIVRHYKQLAHKLFSVDENFYPLGSCTMKYNPRINERIAAMPAFSHLHPYQDDADVQGMLELLYRVRCDLAEIAGLAEVTLQPAAGAHGEMTALMIINAYYEDREEKRSKVLAPDSAHGTNPASCSACGARFVPVRSRDDGRVDLATLTTDNTERAMTLAKHLDELNRNRRTVETRMVKRAKALILGPILKPMSSSACISRFASTSCRSLVKTA